MTTDGIYPAGAVAGRYGAAPVEAVIETTMVNGIQLTGKDTAIMTMPVVVSSERSEVMVGVQLDYDTIRAGHLCREGRLGVDKVGRDQEEQNCANEGPHSDECRDSTIGNCMVEWN